MAAVPPASVAPAPTVALALGAERDLAYRLDRLTADRPCEDRRGVAVAATGLLAAGLLAILDRTIQPTGLVAAVTVTSFGVALLGIDRPDRGGQAEPVATSPASSAPIVKPASRHSR